MQVRRTTVSHEPILLLDPEMDSRELAKQLELNDFPTRMERTGAAAQAAIKGTHFESRSRPLY